MRCKLKFHCTAFTECVSVFMVAILHENKWHLDMLAPSKIIWVICKSWKKTINPTIQFLVISSSQ